jgi:4-aminobutyrate aminotransferase-like enzyme
MIGVELVADPKTKEPAPSLARRLRRTCLENGLLVEVGGHHANVIRFLPPLVISQALLERGIEIFLEALRIGGGAEAAA